MRKMKPKLLALLLGVFAAAAFAAGCNPNKKKTDPDALKIGVVRAGYGSNHTYELARAYQKKTGTKVQVVQDTPESSFVWNSLMQGPSRNKIDIYFGIPYGPIFDKIVKHDFVEGYNPPFADLSDIYESPAVGYKESEANPNLKIKDILNPHAIDILTFHGDGKRYQVPFTQAMQGYVYNKTLLDATNKKLGGQGKEPLALPKTTDEMFAMFDRMVGFRKDGTIESRIYPLKYCGTVAYLGFVYQTWWAQYEGYDAFNRFTQGKNEADVYTADIFSYGENGRRYSYDVIKRMLEKKAGTGNDYKNSDDQAAYFTTAQLQFLEGDAFFNVNGDWLEREMESNFKRGEVETGFLKVPVVSVIANKLHSFDGFSGAAKDEKLREAIDYVDYLDGYTLYGVENTVSERPSYLTNDDLAALTEARHIVCSQVFAATNIVPAYSGKIDEAKDFLKFMLSKEGQEIVMKASYGINAPLNVDMSQFEYTGSADCTHMTETRNEIFSKGVLVGDGYRYPIMYLGGMALAGAEPVESAFAGVQQKTVKQHMDNEVSQFSAIWGDMMNLAGLKNS